MSRIGAYRQALMKYEGASISRQPTGFKFSIVGGSAERIKPSEPIPHFKRWLDRDHGRDRFYRRFGDSSKHLQYRDVAIRQHRRPSCVPKARSWS
jgi:hypothetical protein